MLPSPPQVEKCIKQSAAYLRNREADKLRGQPRKLDHLETLTDVDIVKQWCFSLAIPAALVSFIALPIGVTLVRFLLPAVLVQLLWFCTKICMAVTATIGAIAVYLTFSAPSDN
jgi:hypothetical protein